MAKTYEPIATTTLGSDTASVTFSSISGSYTDLRLVCAGSFTAGYTGSNFRFNGDTGNNYSNTWLLGSSTAAVSGRNSSTSKAFLQMSGGQSIVIADFLSYSNTTTYKTVLIQDKMPDNTEACNVIIASLYRSTSAISSISIQPDTGNISAGSTFTLYGIASA